MTEKPHYAIMRIGKIHTRTVLDAVEWHNTRRGAARVVEGLGLPDEWVKRKGAYRDRADDILREVGATHDEGKILAVEVLVTASPEWWDTATDEQKREWWLAQYAYAKHLFGPGLLAFTPHLDESTPHAQFVGLPLYHAVKKKTGPKPKDPEDLRKRLEEEANAPKIWRLSHDAVFGGGPEGLAAHQTAYHGFVAHLGLSRGRDTVGLGIKNIPLKRYAQLLTQMDRDLQREAEEIANERQIQSHYDQQLREGFERQRLQREAIERDELELFAKQNAFDEREQRIIAAEQEIAADREALLERENRISVEENSLAEREKDLDRNVKSHEEAKERLEARRSLLNIVATNQRSKEDSLSKREKQVEKRDESVLRREAQITEREAAVEGKQAEVERSLAQFSVLTGVFSGRLAVTWNDKRQPTLESGEATLQEQSVLSTTWPALLATALRHAMAMTAIRKRLADKIQWMRGKLRAQRQAAATREAAAEAAQASAELQVQKAENQSAIAEKTMIAAEKAKELATKAQKNADADRRAADARIHEAETVTIGIGDRRAELESLDEVVSSNRSNLADLESAVTRTAAELETLRGEETLLRETKEALAADKTALQAEVDGLASQRDDLKAQQTKTEAERAKLDSDKKKWDRSMAVWNQAAKAGAAVATTAQGVVVRVNADEIRPAFIVTVAELDPSVVSLISQRDALEQAMIATHQLADHLDERYGRLATRYPDQKQAIEADRVEDRKVVEAVWASIGEAGEGR